MKTNKKIFIAEDELLIAKVLKRQFEQLGFVVQTASDANEVFEQVKQMQPDVIILDVKLKNNSCGFTAGKRIREAGIVTPIIFTTGNSYDDTVDAIKAISFSRALSKPVEFEHLLQVINKFS